MAAKSSQPVPVVDELGDRVPDVHQVDFQEISGIGGRLAGASVDLIGLGIAVGSACLDQILRGSASGPLGQRKE